MRKYRTCIFVNGCFWHGHEGCRYYTIPKTNTEFWLNKVKRNKERDLKVQHELAAMGWHSITIWECELKPVKREDTLESLAYTLNKIFLQDRTVKRYEILEEEPMIAAEDVPATYKNKVHSAWRCYSEAVIVYIKMHLTSHHCVVTMDEMVNHSLQNSTFRILWFILSSIRQFLPASLGV